MEVAAAFLLVIILVAVAIVGAVVWGIASHLRRKQLDPRGDLVEGEDGQGRPEERPEHVRARPDQRTRFVPHR
jgi:hypothetical protein